MAAPDRLEDPAAFAAWLFHQECQFLRGIAKLDDLPPQAEAEVAFAGRSNVGKSSLLNALTGQNQLARTSRTPGRTQQINFFSLGPADHRVGLVDLPGYGYAKASKRDIAAWTDLVRDYLRGRVTLRRAFILVDSRHGLKDSDLETMTLLDQAAVAYQVILTKADKPRTAGVTAVRDAVTAVLKKHPAAHPEVLATSSREKIGLEAVREVIAELAT